MFETEDSNSIRNSNHVNASDDMMRGVERLLVDMGDRMARLDISMATLSRGNEQRYLMQGYRVDNSLREKGMKSLIMLAMWMRMILMELTWD